MNKNKWAYKRFGRGIGKKNLPINIRHSKPEGSSSFILNFFIGFAVGFVVLFAIGYCTREEPKDDIVGLLIEEHLKEPVVEDKETKSTVPVVKKNPPVNPVENAVNNKADVEKLESQKAELSQQKNILSAKMDNATRPEDIGHKLVVKKQDATKVIEKKSSSSSKADKESKKSAGKIKTAEQPKRSKGRLFFKKAKKSSQSKTSIRPRLKETDARVASVAVKPKRRLDFRDSENEADQPYEPIVRKLSYEDEKAVAVYDSPKMSLNLRKDINEPSVPTVKPGNLIKDEMVKTEVFAQKRPLRADFSKKKVSEKFDQPRPLTVKKPKLEQKIVETQAEVFTKKTKISNLAVTGSGRSGRGSGGSGQRGIGEGSTTYSTGGAGVQKDSFGTERYADRKPALQISERDLPICPSGLSDVGIKGEIIRFMKDSDLEIGATCSNSKGVFRFEGELGIYSLNVILNAKSKIEFKNKCDFLSSAYECLVNTGCKK